MSGMTTEIDFTTDGEYAEHDEVKIVLRAEQLEVIADLLGGVKRTVIAERGDEAVAMILDFIEGAHAALGID